MRAVWGAVDRYVTGLLIEPDPALDAALAASEAAGLPSGAIPASFGRLLELLVRISGARRVLELGTLGGYSTIWLARALPPDGKLISLEANARYAEVARANIAKAGLAEKVEVRVGPALESLPVLASEGRVFDLTFIDADKKNNAAYLEWVLGLSRPGSVIIADNVIRGGKILDPASIDDRLDAGGIEGLRRFYEALAARPGLAATAIQTVTGKGHDGFAVALVEHE